jgi:hypothetical protein
MNSYEQYGSNFRTETNDELEKALEQEEHVQQINTPATDDTPAPQYVDEEGETRQLVEGDVAPTPTAEEAPVATAEEEDPAEVKADRDFDLIEQAGNWIKTEVLGLDLDRRAAAESQDPAISEPAKAEIEAERTEFQDTYGSENVAVAAARNTTRMVTSGVEKGVQDVIGFGNFAGDLAKTKLGLVEEDDQWNNVDHAEYKGSRRDLLASQPTSSAGLFARDMVGFLGIGSGVKAVTGLGKVATAAGKLGGVKGMAARSGTDLVIGALADVMADPGDGNATNMLIEFFPGLKDNAILAALAHEDDDNEFTRRLLNAVEGGVMQNAVDAAGLTINALRKGAKPLRDWIRSHLGKTAKDAPPELIQEATSAFEEAVARGLTPKAPMGDPKAYKTPQIQKMMEELNAQANRPAKEADEAKMLHKQTQEVVEEFNTLKAEVGAKKAAEATAEKAMQLAKTYEQQGIDFDSLYGQQNLQLAEAGYLERPGKRVRDAEAEVMSGTKTRQDFEPYERAGQSSSFPIDEVIKQQRFKAKGPTMSAGGPNFYLTNNTTKQLTEVGGEMTVINKATDELVGTYEKKLKSSDPEVRAEMEEVIEQWKKDNAEYSDVDNSSLLELRTDEQGVKESYVRTMAGNNAVKALVADQSNQLKVLADNTSQITASGMDANKQYNMTFDRLKGLIRLQITDGSKRGSKLAGLKDKVIYGSSKAATDMKVAKLDKKIEELRTRVNQGDPEAMESMRTFTEAIQLADGDATMTLDFTDQFFRLTRANFETTMYNAYLSGLATQERNVLGNLTNALVRPTSLYLGSMGNSTNQRAALSMFVSLNDSIKEGWQVAKTSFINNNPDPFSQIDGVSKSNLGEKVANLAKQAKTPQEKWAANWVGFQYKFFASPWVSGATRMMEAGDNGFRVMAARQKAKFDAVQMAIEDGIEFSPEKFEQALEFKIKDGRVVDEELLKWSKQDTFQEELGPMMQRAADLINDVPMMKYAIPFVKTPTNIIKQTATFIPGAQLLAYARVDSLPGNFFKEYAEIMRGSDEVAKAVYRGREAIGVMTGVTFMTMGYNGISTGAGPRDPGLREVWLENNRPHSINVGGTWISNRWLGPIGILMSSFSDLGFIGANRGTYETQGELAQQLMYTTAGALFEQSWAKGLFSVMDSLAKLSAGADNVVDPQEWQASLIRSMIPYQAALRNFNNTLVPGIRDYNSAFEKVAAESIPFAKGMIGVERTSMFTGEPVVSGGVAALNQAVPFSLAEVKNDKVLGRLIELGVSVPMEFNEKYKGVELKVEDISALNTIAAKDFKLRDKVEKLIESQWFKDSLKDWKEPPKDPEKAENWQPTPRADAEWYKEIRQIFTESRNYAIDEYSKQRTPEAQAFKRTIELIDDRDFHNRRGNYKEASKADELLNFQFR